MKANSPAGFDRRALTLAGRGNELLGLGRYDEARRSFEMALSLFPACVVAHNGLGLIENARGDVLAAIAHFEDALRAEPNVADVESNLGYALAEAGDMESAIEHLRRAIALGPRNPRHYRLLLLVNPDALEAAHVAVLERLGTEPETLSKPQRIELHFALGKIYDRQGRIDEAFAQFSAGNREKRADTPYDESRNLRFFAGLPRILRPEFLAGLRGAGNPSDRPIFVFGMPRSGTTLIAQTLAAHPDVTSAGELGIFSGLVDKGLPPINAATAAESVRSSVADLAYRYLTETESLAKGRSRLVDKTLLNFVLAPMINAALPNARLIYVRRDPLDTCWSTYTTLFSDNLMFAYDLGELGRYYRAQDALMDAWRRVLPADRFLEVRYEDVIDDLELQARRIVEFCGLSWSPACLDFHKCGGVVRTASVGQVRSPLYRNAIGAAQRYRRHLTELIANLSPAT